MKKASKVLSLLIIWILMFNMLFVNTDIAFADEDAVSGTCGDTISWILGSNGTLLIEGTGKLSYPSQQDKNSWYPYIDKIKKVIIKEGITEISFSVFEMCYNLTSVELPEGMTSIGNMAFYECYNLSDINFPESMTSLGSEVFYSCSSLSHLKIPANLTSIGEYTFNGCSKLDSIEVAKENPVYDSRNNCNAIIETKSNKLITGCKNTKIPDNVTSIATYAISFCDELSSIQIPASVTNIEDSAFYQCGGVMYIEVVEENPVYDSRNNCNAIIKTASNELVLGCNNTKIPSGITSIKDYALFNCKNLSSIEIPTSVSNIGEYAFKGCSGLNSIIVSKDNPVYDSRNDCNAIIKTRDNDLIVGCNNTKIPTSVTKIGDSAFYECSQLNSVEMASVNKIGNSAFSGCTGLTDIKFSDRLWVIGNMAFYNCNKLKHIEIPSSVDNIGRYVFYYCSGLIDITNHSKVTISLSQVKDDYSLVLLGIYNDSKLKGKWVLKGTSTEVTDIANGQTAVWKNNETSTDVKYGDVNGDGDINIGDAVFLKKHLANMNVTIDEKASDVNLDGDINISDAILILKSLAGMNVVLGSATQPTPPVEPPTQPVEPPTEDITKNYPDITIYPDRMMKMTTSDGPVYAMKILVKNNSPYTFVMGEGNDVMVYRKKNLTSSTYLLAITKDSKLVSDTNEFVVAPKESTYFYGFEGDELTYISRNALLGLTCKINGKGYVVVVDDKTGKIVNLSERQ